MCLSTRLRLIGPARGCDAWAATAPTLDGYGDGLAARVAQQ